CGLRMREDKGARTFLALACAIVPVNFCQLGALVYSRLASYAGNYPIYATLQAPNDVAAATAFGLGMLVLTVLSLIAFTALARSRSLLLTTAYIGLNALLLVPTRDPNSVGALLLLGTIGLAAMEARTLRTETSLKTPEGFFVRLMIGVPLILLAAR